MVNLDMEPLNIMGDWYQVERNQGCAGRPLIPRGGAGRGKGKNPRGGAKVKIRGAGRGGAKKRANQPIQNFYKSAKNIILHIIILIII